MWTMTGHARRALPLAAGLVLGACGDEVTGPGRTRSMGEAGRASAVAQPAAIPNAVKYRDAGHKPATGRSGGATLTVRALQGRDGTTDLEVLAGAASGAAPVELKKVQLKLFEADGSHLATTNYNGLSGASAVFPLDGLVRNTPLQVQANIAGADGPRTGVVTVSDVVKLRPDLAITELVAPPTGVVALPITMSAVLRELNGDVGARTDCVLEVDGVAADSAAGAWVDASGTVSCAFSHAFTEPGTYTLRARASGVDPADYDDGNNAASRTIVIVRDVPFTSYSASARSDTLATWTEHSYDFVLGGNSYHYSRSDRTERSGSSQYATFYAFIRQPIAYPGQPLTDVRVSQETNGATLHAATYEMLAAEDSSGSPSDSTWCVRRASGGEIVASLAICAIVHTSGGVATRWTSVTYDWHAGDVTYRSIGYDLESCAPWIQCSPNSYVWNTTSRTQTGRLVTFGTDFTTRVSIITGTDRYSVVAVIPLRPERTSYGDPLRCTAGFAVWPPIGRMGFLRECHGHMYEQSMVVGTVSG